MRLHEDSKLFVQAIRATAQEMGIQEIYVEKDYWVTFALKKIFFSDIGEEVVFKGGTALSKCFQLIQRFSEDIDLVVLRTEKDTGNQLKTKLKRVSNAVLPELPEVEIEGITNKLGMIRKTAHSYSKAFTGNYGQVRDVIIIESTWLGYHEPFKHFEISAFVYQMMHQRSQFEFIERYELSPFTVKVLDPRRTLCEKIMSLVRFSHTEDPISDLRNKIRHAYDLHLILLEKELFDFFESDVFDQMLLQVAHDDINSYRSGNEWLKIHPKEALIFKDLDSTWAELEKTYNDSSGFAGLVYGELPKSLGVKLTLARITKRLEKLTWEVNDPKN